MNESAFEKTTEQAAAFQKIWMESISKGMQAAMTFSPTTPPTEIMQQMRSSIFETLARSWEEFMRSPQFLEGMRQTVEQTVNFRKMSNEFMGKLRNEMQSPSRDDIDTVMVTVRHIEKRLLDRVEELSAQVNALSERPSAQPASATPPPRAAAKRKNTKDRKISSD